MIGEFQILKKLCYDNKLFDKNSCHLNILSRFVDELKAVKKVTQYRVEAAMAMVNGGFVRPESLRGSGSSNSGVNTAASTSSIRMQGAKGAGMNNAVGLSDIDGVQVINTFRGGQFIIEDKRLRKKKRAKLCDAEMNTNTNETIATEVKEMDKTSQSIPSWVMLSDLNDDR